MRQAERGDVSQEAVKSPLGVAVTFRTRPPSRDAERGASNPRRCCYRQPFGWTTDLGTG